MLLPKPQQLGPSASAGLRLRECMREADMILVLVHGSPVHGRRQYARKSVAQAARLPGLVSGERHLPSTALCLGKYTA